MIIARPRIAQVTIAVPVSEAASVVSAVETNFATASTLQDALAAQGLTTTIVSAPVITVVTGGSATGGGGGGGGSGGGGGGGGDGGGGGGGGGGGVVIAAGGGLAVMLLVAVLVCLWRSKKRAAAVAVLVRDWTPVPHPFGSLDRKSPMASPLPSRPFLAWICLSAFCFLCPNSNLTEKMFLKI